ncbi:MAG: arsenic metallochaperone ArsD family protein [Clostridia bacterium]|nr:arsenic metallochaperone ArsD family protein [Clostridia bacterium]
MAVIEIFETIPCCSSSIDKEVVRVSGIVSSLKQKGVEIIRYNLSKEPQAFVDNKIINDYITQHGVKMLPITLVDKEIAKLEAYPSSDEFSKWTGMEITEPAVEPEGKKSSCCCG